MIEININPAKIFKWSLSSSSYNNLNFSNLTKTKIDPISVGIDLMSKNNFIEFHEDMSRSPTKKFLDSPCYEGSGKHSIYSTKTKKEIIAMFKNKKLKEMQERIKINLKQLKAEQEFLDLKREYLNKYY